MANYIGAARTNYFQVMDEEAFDRWLSHLDDVEKFTIEGEDGQKLFGFGCYGTPLYICDQDEEAYDAISCPESIAEIQSFLAEGHALIYISAGWEKLRYVSGYALVVTKDAARAGRLEDMALGLARALLGDEAYSPQMDY